MSVPFEKFNVQCVGHGKGQFVVLIKPPSDRCALEREQLDFIEQAIGEKLTRERERLAQLEKR